MADHAGVRPSPGRAGATSILPSGRSWTICTPAWPRWMRSGRRWQSSTSGSISPSAFCCRATSAPNWGRDRAPDDAGSRPGPPAAGHGVCDRHADGDNDHPWGLSPGPSPVAWGGRQTPIPPSGRRWSSYTPVWPRWIRFSSRLLELEERVDFTERLLAQAQQPARLGAPPKRAADDRRGRARDVSGDRSCSGRRCCSVRSARRSPGESAVAPNRAMPMPRSRRCARG